MYYFIAIIQLWRAKTLMAYPWRINSPWRILLGPVYLYKVDLVFTYQGLCIFVQSRSCFYTSGVLNSYG